MLCALIYRPPQYNKDFLDEFATFLAQIFCKYDHLLLLGDFNIHVCCPDRPMVKDFLDLVDSFGLSQLVNGPTRGHVHTLDLVLSHGLSNSDLVILPATFSDHSPVLFNLDVASTSRTDHVHTRLSRVITPSTAGDFVNVFALISAPCDFTVVDSYLHLLNSSCLAAMDSVAPLKSRLTKIKPDPWLNERTRSIRQNCRRLERKWSRCVYCLL
nr:uncharacterized protein LOC129161845 [Nothobranchius furzeri]